jgi:signal transduction histidine kinase
MSPARADEGADRDKCIAKGEEAAKLIKEVGRETAFKKIEDYDGGFRWAKGYIFVIEDEKATLLAHRAYPGSVGQNLFNLTDTDGKLLYQEILRIAKTKGKGWITCNRSFGKKEIATLSKCRMRI